jgi:outer membrane protein
MLYTNPIHDYTDYILEELGISPDQLKEKEREENEAKTSEDSTTEVKTTKGKSSSKTVSESEVVEQPKSNRKNTTIPKKE